MRQRRARAGGQSQRAAPVASALATDDREEADLISRRLYRSAMWPCKSGIARRQALVGQRRAILRRLARSAFLDDGRL